MTFTHTPASARQTSQRVRALVGVFVIVLTQVSVASHQFEHLPNDITQSCQICIQQDKSDDALVFLDAAAIIAVAVLPISTTTNGLSFVEAITFHRSRAPPLS